MPAIVIPPCAHLRIRCAIASRETETFIFFTAGPVLETVFFCYCVDLYYLSYYFLLQTFSRTF